MRLRLLVSCCASFGVSFVAAQPNASPKADELVESFPSIFAPRARPKDARSEGASRPAPSTPSPRRAISPEMAAKLSAIAARAVPPAGATPSPGIATTAPSEDSSDAVQLKPYIVREDRVPDFKERDLLTPKAKLALARLRYPGLGRLGDAAALKRLEEDLLKERLQEMTDLQGLLEIGGAKPSPDLKRIINDARHAEPFSPQFGRPSGPPK